MIDPIELPRIGWVTLADAAARLGVTPWQARGWVRTGRMHAELRRGPEGPHYYVPIHQVEALAAELGVLAAAQASLPAIDASSIDDATLVRVLLDLRAEVQQAVETRDATDAALREELNQIRAEIAAGIEALKLARVPVEVAPPTEGSRPWWRSLRLGSIFS